MVLPDVPNFVGRSRSIESIRLFGGLHVYDLKKAVKKERGIGELKQLHCPPVNESLY